MKSNTHVKTAEGGRPLNEHEKGLLWALADEHGRYGAYAEASMDDLAYWCRVHVDTVRRALRTLERDKVMVVDRPPKSYPGERFRYVVDETMLYYQNRGEKGCYQLPLRVADSNPKGLLPARTIPKAPIKHPSTDEVGSSVSFPKLVEAGSSDRPTDHGRPASRKGAKRTSTNPVNNSLRRFTAEDVAAVLGVLADLQVVHDDASALTILNAAELIAPGVSVEQVCGAVRRVGCRLPNPCERPVGIICHRLKGELAGITREAAELLRRAEEFERDPLTFRRDLKGQPH